MDTKPNSVSDLLEQVRQGVLDAVPDRLKPAFDASRPLEERIMILMQPVATPTVRVVKLAPDTIEGQAVVFVEEDCGDTLNIINIKGERHTVPSSSVIDSWTLNTKDVMSSKFMDNLL